MSHAEQSQAKEGWVDFSFIKKRVSIETVLRQTGHIDRFRQSGDEWIGPCPFHDNKEKKTPFQASIRKNTYFCFACKNAGNILELTAKIRHVNIKEAGQWLMQFIDGKESPESPKPVQDVADGSGQNGYAPQPVQEAIQDTSLRDHEAEVYTKTHALVSAAIDLFETCTQQREDLIQTISTALTHALVSTKDH